ncbi:hypothetical protein Taro_049926, partial [Colocasia esculenta]|nr:hypothetical protein [Colocasia esculenta]
YFPPKISTLLFPFPFANPRNPRCAEALHLHHLSPRSPVSAPCIAIVSDTRRRSLDDIGAVHRLSPRIATPRRASPPRASPSIPSTVGRAREPLFEPSDTTFEGRGGILIVSASNLVYHVKGSGRRPPWRQA